MSDKSRYGESTTVATGPTLALCECCTAHGDSELDWALVTCPVCNQPCSCSGCVEDDWLVRDDR